MGAEGVPAPPIWFLPEAPERKWGLGRAEIVRAAIEIADRGGAEAITMRAVATKLGAATPMSLYRYVHSKEGLVDLMLDAAGAEVSTPDEPGEDWRAELTALYRAEWAMMRRHPWYAVLVHSRPPAGPNASRRHEFVLASFAKLGQDPARSLGFSRLLDGYTAGLALQQAEEEKMWRRNNFTSADQVRDQVREWWPRPRDGAPYPHLASLMESFLDGSGSAPDVDAQFELGLACLVDGIAARL